MSLYKVAVGGVVQSRAVGGDRSAAVGNVSSGDYDLDFHLAQPLGRHASAILFGLAVVCGVAACFIPYPTKVDARGYVAPVGGTFSLKSNGAGTVTKVLVAEGQGVREGQAIVELSLDQNLVAGSRAELEAITAEAETVAGREKLRVEYDSVRYKANQATIAEALADRQVALLERQEAIAQDQLRRNRATLDKGRGAYELKYISGNQWRLWETAVAQSETALLGIQEQRLRAETDLRTARQERQRLKSQLSGEAADLGLLVAKRDQRNLDIEKDRRQVIVAPRKAIVSNISVNPGSSVATGEQLAVLVPERTTLVAELWLDAGSIGFVEPGSTVVLMYDAFPYQKYGSARGKVLYVSRVPTSVPSVLNSNAQSGYKVVVSIDSPVVSSSGKRWPIPYGSPLTAKIILENKTVAAHLLSPLQAR